MNDEAAVERVAEALYNLEPDYHLTMGRTILKPWQDARGDYKTLARKRARAAIAAMPTPPVAVSEAMVVAGAAAYTDAQLAHMRSRLPSFTVTDDDMYKWHVVSMRKALEAALGVQEAPLEEELDDIARGVPGRYVGYTIRKRFAPDSDAVITATVRWADDANGTLWEQDADGPTIRDAIRDAVQCAKAGGES